MSTRYELYQRSGSTELYANWLRERMLEWAKTEPRASELKIERLSGWHFPILCTQAHHDAFDLWLTGQVDKKGGGQ